jgi:hypothetical protein
MRRGLLAALVLLAASGARSQDDPVYSETIDVVRYSYIIPARVVDLQGRAIPDITAEELTATIGGKKAIVESVEWLGSGEAGAAPADAGESRPGRLIVVFMQTDFQREPLRVMGQLRFNTLISTILEMFEPEDYVAVVSQDSHLKLQCDFTRDRERARVAIEKSIEIRRMELPPVPDSGPSLARHLELQEMRRASKPGAALGIVARALAAQDGQKLVIVGGWGIGEMVNRRVVLDRTWAEAMALYRASRTPVITLGTGAGGSLTYGLVTTAVQTGGFYAGTQSFPSQSMTRLRGALAGYYEVMLGADAELPLGEHRVVLRTTRPQANVLTAPLTVIRSDEPGMNQMVERPDPSPAPVTATVSAARIYIDALQKLADGEEVEAEALLTRAIDLGKAPEESWYERGLLRAARGEMAAAIADLRAYLDRAPGGRRAAEARDLLESWQ